MLRSETTNVNEKNARDSIEFNHAQSGLNERERGAAASATAWRFPQGKNLEANAKKRLCKAARDGARGSVRVLVAPCSSAPGLNGGALGWLMRTNALTAAR